LTGFVEAAYHTLRTFLSRKERSIALNAKEYRLPEVYINSNESFDASLKRFNKMVQQSGILAEARRREHFEPPSVTRKKKAAAKRRKTAKNAARG